MQTKKSILIVDDDKDYVECLTIMLEAAGFDVSSASNATDCMTAVKRNKPDLIVLDIMMEKLVSGLHVGYELRSDPAFKDSRGNGFRRCRGERHRVRCRR